MKLKTSKLKPAKGYQEPAIPVIETTKPDITQFRKSITSQYVAPNVIASLSLSNPFLINRIDFNAKRYDPSFLNNLKDTDGLDRPIFIIDGEDPDVIILEIGYFTKLETGHWYNIIPIPFTELTKLL